MWPTRVEKGRRGNPRANPDDLRSLLARKGGRRERRVKACARGKFILRGSEKPRRGERLGTGRSKKSRAVRKNFPAGIFFFGKNFNARRLNARRGKAGGELAKNRRKKLRAHLIFKLLIQLKNAVCFRPCLKKYRATRRGFSGRFFCYRFYYGKFEGPFFIGALNGAKVFSARAGFSRRWIELFALARCAAASRSQKKTRPKILRRAFSPAFF